LLAYECGQGFGHVNRLAELAKRLRRRDAATILATFRLHDAEHVANAFDHVLQAPVWPLLFAGERVVVAQSGASFATALVSLGFDDPHYVAANQRAWGSIIEHWNARIVVADYAPGAVLAAKGRCHSIQIGAPFFTPTLSGKTFPPFVPGEHNDGAQEAAILSAITVASGQLGRPAPAGLREAIIGDESMPIGFAEFDSYASQRREPLLTPPMPPSNVERGHGDAVFFYLPEWMQRNDVVMATLCALNQPRQLFLPRMDKDLAESLMKYDVVLASKPFSIEELARSARVFVHHGGTGSSELGLITGVPQIALASDMEKRWNGQALSTLGVGRALDGTRLTLPLLREAITDIFNDDAMHRHAIEVAAKMRSRLSEQHPLDLVTDRVLARL